MKDAAGSEPGFSGIAPPAVLVLSGLGPRRQPTYFQKDSLEFRKARLVVIHSTLLAAEQESP